MSNNSDALVTNTAAPASAGVAPARPNVFSGVRWGDYLGVAPFLIFGVTAQKEAEYLSATFGPAYEAYVRRTPRFWPNPLLYRDQAEWRFSPPALRRTFFDGLYFLAVFPLIELAEHLRVVGALPAFFTLY